MMTPRDLALLRAVQDLGDDASPLGIILSSCESGNVADINMHLERLKYEGYIIDRIEPADTGWEYRACIYWRLTAAGEAALKEGGE